MTTTAQLQARAQPRSGGKWAISSPIERFEAKVDRVSSATGCWLWTAQVDLHGYGQFWADPETGGVKAHRWSYEHFVGPIPDGLSLDHLCRNPPCVNPAHLEPVTTRENLIRGVGFPAQNVAKTHCVHGHALVASNVYRPPSQPTVRVCRQCMRDLANRAYRRKMGRAV